MHVLSACGNVDGFFYETQLELKQFMVCFPDAGRHLASLRVSSHHRAVVVTHFARPDLLGIIIQYRADFRRIRIAFNTFLYTKFGDLYEHYSFGSEQPQPRYGYYGSHTNNLFPIGTVPTEWARRRAVHLQQGCKEV